VANLLKFVLADGRSATLLVGERATVLAVDDTLVSSSDLAGRPYVLVREGGTYRRGLDGGLLWKREAMADAPRPRRHLAAAEGAAVVEAARADAAAALEAVGGRLSAVVSLEARTRLEQIVAMDAAALQSDAERFLAICGPVGVLPPDQYLSLVVRVTEGCSWNACRFCSLYADIPFRVKAPGELARHIAAVRDYFGRSLALRRSVFLGDANALCLAPDRLLPLLEVVAASFPGLPLFSFVDACTGHRRTAAEWGACRALGLSRVYVGLESGEPELVSWLGKPGAPDAALRLVRALHEGGLDAGVIVLVGAGGERFSAAHVARTVEVLTAMRLGPRDIVYLSEYVEDSSFASGRRAVAAPDLAPLSPARARLQQEAIAKAVRRSPGPRIARYHLGEFVY